MAIFVDGYNLLDTLSVRMRFRDVILSYFSNERIIILIQIIKFK
jgi:hypothetical protein